MIFLYRAGCAFACIHDRGRERGAEGARGNGSPRPEKYDRSDNYDAVI